VVEDFLAAFGVKGRAPRAIVGAGRRRPPQR